MLNSAAAAWWPQLNTTTERAAVLPDLLIFQNTRNPEFMLNLLFYFIYLFLKILFVYLFLERGEEREKERERNINVAPTGDLACNPGICPECKLNQQPFGSPPMLNPLSYTSQG